MKTAKLFIAALTALGFASCGGGSGEKNYSENDYAMVMDFQDGIAVAYIPENGGLVLIDETYKPLTRPYYHVSNFVNGYAIAETRAGEHDSIFALDRNFHEQYLPGRTLSCNDNPDVNDMGNAWIETFAHDAVFMVRLADGKQLTEPLDRHVFIEQILNNGNYVMRRPLTGGIHPTWDYAIYAPDGTPVAPFGTYTFIGDFSDGMARYSTNGYAKDKHMHQGVKEDYLVDRYGYDTEYASIGWINDSGEIVIPAVYPFATDFNENGVAAITDKVRGSSFNKTFRYINRQGQYVNSDGSPL